MSFKKESQNGIPLNKAVNSAYGYAEIHRLRENIMNILLRDKQKTILVTSPHDYAGNTFLVSVLGFNIAYFSKMKVLLVDMNMRKPQLHIPFSLNQEGGVSEIASGIAKINSVIKNTSLPGLNVITGGRTEADLSRFLKRSFLDNMIAELKKHFDLIIFDTSPVLVQNRNNVDPTFLSLICDKVVIVVQGKKTTKTELESAVSAIPQGRVKISGLVYNHQF